MPHKSVPLFHICSPIRSRFQPAMELTSAIAPSSNAKLDVDEHVANPVAPSKLPMHRLSAVAAAKKRGSKLKARRGGK